MGIVQGVGFRPFVARLAADLSLAGLVRNTTTSVLIEIEGPPARLESFRFRLEAEAPPAATLEHVDVETIGTLDALHFEILSSGSEELYSAGLPPDLAICSDCCRELEDPTDRRYRYPFLNCTACGPRYSIVEGLPYDRDHTSMRTFVMCAACRTEYGDRNDRRYHAQPVACPACGPKLWFERDGRRLEGDAIELCLEALAAGEIGAIRSIGGFHLACDARNSAAVERLRSRKARGDQPFALMVRDLATAREFVEVNRQAAALLGAAAAPIVLLAKAGSTQLSEDMAPGNGYLGVMLPYSPLHRLLLFGRNGLDALVMTSGNLHGEPVVTVNEEASEKLGGQADFYLKHNREIVAPCDDSVVRLYRGRALAIRRGRGYAPVSLGLPSATVPALAAGADLKCALGLSHEGRAYLSPHIGDMENLATLEAFTRNLRHISSLYRCRPELVLYDAHPGYLSTQWARQYAAENNLPSRAVQHHRAHAAAVMAEYGVDPALRVVAVVFDGTGFGDDGAIWGGEFFSGNLNQLRRSAHLPYVALPGGDASAKRPALAAIAHLHAVGLDWLRTPSGASLDPSQRGLLQQQLDRGLNCHLSSSMGRFFDAAASLLGIRHRVSFEAQAAIEMEAVAAQWKDHAGYTAGLWNTAELWAEMLADDASPVAARARRFHETVVRWSCETAKTLAADERVDTVVLSGGVFQNLLLLEGISVTLEKAGLRVLVPRYLPPNDGGLALGQLYLGANLT